MKDITAERIKERRNLLRMTQQELCDKIGFVNRSSITKIEKNSQGLPLDKLQQIAKALDCSPSYLMGWTDDPAPIKNAPIQQDEREIATDLFNSLSEEKKKEALQFLRFLNQQENR